MGMQSGRPGYALGASWRAARFRGLSVVSPLVIVCVMSVLVVQVHALLLSSLHHAIKRLNLATITLSRRMTRLPFSVLTFFGSALMVTRSWSLIWTVMAMLFSCRVPGRVVVVIGGFPIR